MYWRIRGINAETGTEMMLSIAAADHQTAIQQVSERGIVVLDIEYRPRGPGGIVLDYLEPERESKQFADGKFYKFVVKALTNCMGFTFFIAGLLLLASIGLLIGSGKTSDEALGVFGGAVMVMILASFIGLMLMVVRVMGKLLK